MHIRDTSANYKRLNQTNLGEPVRLELTRDLQIRALVPFNPLKYSVQWSLILASTESILNSHLMGFPFFSFRGKEKLRSVSIDGLNFKYS